MNMKSIYTLVFMWFSICMYSQTEIDLYKNKNNKQEVKLSTIAKNIKYIQLETNDDCLLGNELQVCYTPDYIFIGDQKNGEFYRFGSNGSFLNKIGKQGEGPEEYTAAMFFHIDESLKHVHIISTQSRMISTYDYEGNFINKVRLSQTPWNIHKLNNNYIIYNNRFNRIKGQPDVKELFVIDPSGKTQKEIPTTIKNEEDDMVLFEFPFFYTYKNNLFYKNPINKEVYLLDKDYKLKTAYKINTGDNTRRKDDFKNIKQYAERMSVRAISENNAFVIICYAQNDDFHYMLFDKATKRTTYAGKSQSGFIDDFNNGPLFRPFYLTQNNHNTLISVLTSDNIEAQNNLYKNLLSKYPNLAKRKEDDNPIIGIVQLK
ncbi:6-bladed beta-propeller [Parabacteroides sp. APC149_11_2_Y6]